MRTIYAIQLHVAPPDGHAASAVFTDLSTSMRQWVEGNYLRAWATTLSVPIDGQALTPLADHSIRALSRAAADSELFSLDWTHPADADPSTAWVTNVVIARHGDLLQAAILLRISTTRVVLRPVRFDLWRPRIVTGILERYRVSVDGWEVPQNVEQLSSPQVQQYVDNVLLNGTRNLPVVFLSPDVWNESFSADANDIFDQVRGFAHVTVLADKWAAFKLTDVVGKPLSCYGGAVRIFWPGFALNDNRFQHKLFLPHSIRAHEQQGLPLSRHLFRILAAVASYRYVEGSVIRTVRREFSRADQAHVEQLRENIRSGQVAKDNLENELLEALVQIDDLQKERDQLRDDLDAQKAAWAEFESFRAADSDEEAPHAMLEHAPVDSVLDAVRVAEEQFSETISFLESAIKLAEESPFQSPELAFGLFESLDELVKKWRKDGNIGATWKEALADKSFTYKPDISQSAKQKKFVGDYQFMYDGKKHLFGEHVTFGKGQDPQKCMSVHWLRDEKKKRLIVARCGKHGANTLT
jgi:hypothetical protein